ncbi:D-aminoacyl-tRNA deacylase, partial [Meloidogyne graminicola]
VEQLVNSVLESVFVGEIFRIHRELTINKLIGFKDFGDDEDDKTNEGKHNTRKSTSVSVPLLNHRSMQCRCFVCNRMIAATRFAPHLEKCIGIGRNTRQLCKVRRRTNLTSTYEVTTTSSSVVRTTRSSTLRSATKINNQNNFSEKVNNLNFIEEEKREEEENNNFGDEEEEEEFSLRDRLRNKPHPLGSGKLIDAYLPIMKAIIQRVKQANVIVDQQTISSIGRGICVLIGICREDVDEDIEYIVRKILNLRLFENPENGKRWDKSIVDLGLEVLSVSQFTLHAQIKGNKLDFHRSMNPEDAPLFYSKYLEKLKVKYIPDRIKDGKFGSLMFVNIENDGPVTITLDKENTCLYFCVFRMFKIQLFMNNRCCYGNGKILNKKMGK